MSFLGNLHTVSIIIPIYNAEGHLKACLSSVCNQTYDNLEIICINDGSTDSSASIIELFSKTDSRIKTITKANGGLSSARNAGLENCTGDYICFVDADDMLEKHAVKTMLQECLTTNSDILVFGASMLFPDHWQASSSVKQNISTHAGSYVGNNILEKAIFDENACNVYVWNKLYSKRLFETGIRFNDSITFGEDRCFLFDIFPMAQKVTVIEDSLYYYRQNVANSLTSRYATIPFERTQWKVQILKHIFNRWITLGDAISHAAMDRLFKWGNDYIERSVQSLSDDERSLIREDFYKVLIKEGVSMDYQLVDFLTDVLAQPIRSCEEICVGHSTAKKYEIQTQNQRLFVRVMPHQEGLERKYKWLQQIGSEIEEIVTPTYVWKWSNFLVVADKWFDAVPLDEYYISHPGEPQKTMAKRVGEALRKFHNATVCNPSMICNILSQEQINEFVALYNIQISEATSTACSNIAEMSGPCSLVHYDLRPANVLVSEAGEVRIIDFEYIEYMPSYLDLTFCMMLSDRFQEYTHGVLDGYFDGQVPQSFYQQLKPLIIYELIRYSENPRNDFAAVSRKAAAMRKYLEG